MEKLSPEIVSAIIDELCAHQDQSQTRPRLSLHSTISRSWQFAVEQRLFRRLCLRSDAESLTQFSQIYRYDRRRASVREIRFEIILPSAAGAETDATDRQNAFAKALTSFLGELKRWENDVSDIEANSLQINLVGVQEQDHGSIAGKEGAYRPSIRDEHLESIPVLGRVTSLLTTVRGELTIDPKTACRIASRMPRLQLLDLEFWDPGTPFKHRETSVAVRLALAEGLNELQNKAPGLKVLHIRREGRSDPWNHSKELEVGQDENDVVDKLCEAIRRFTQNGVVEDLMVADILISLDLFQDRKQVTREGEAQTLVWSTLRRFNIISGIVDPKGNWYYTGSRESKSPVWSTDEFDTDLDDSSGDSREEEQPRQGWRGATDMNPQHCWRDCPDASRLNPLISGLVEAVKHMPRLQRGCFEIKPEPLRWHGIDFQCIAPGQTFDGFDKWFTGDRHAPNWRVILDKELKWRLPEDIRTKMEEWAGKGNVTLERFYPETMSLEVLDLDSD